MGASARQGLTRRLFVAVTPPETLRARLARFRDRLAATGADVKWVEEANLHLTLKFLGEVSEDRLAEIQEALRQAAAVAAPFDLELGGLGTFPPRGRPRVVWAGCTVPPAGRDPRPGGDPLQRLHRASEDSLHRCGFAREDRPFSAHLTLGRVRSPRGLEPLQKLLASLPDEAVGRFRVDVFVLMESRLSSQGPTYLRVETYPLTARPA